MHNLFHVDRDFELELLNKFLATDTKQRILFLQGMSGFGKTFLLERYHEEIETRNCHVAYIDLTRIKGSVIDVMSDIGYQWGWKNFPTFQLILEGFMQRVHNIDVKGNWQFGQSQIYVSQGTDLHQLKAFEIQLTNAWFEDLRDWVMTNTPAVILVDSYNPQAGNQSIATIDPVFQAWFENNFLYQIKNTPNLRLILAGQKVPEYNRKWEKHCYRHELGPINDPDAWMTLVNRAGASITREVIHAFCITEHGHPYSIATRLIMLCSRWNGSI